MEWHFRGEGVEIREGEDRSVIGLTNWISTVNVKSLVPDSNVEDSERPPYDGEYVGTIEVVVLRCYPSSAGLVIGNEPSSDESSDGSEKSMPANLDGASDPQPRSTSQSKYQTQIYGLDGGWDDWGPPPPLEEPKMGRIEMTSENTGTWNPVGRASKSNNAPKKTKEWDKRSESRDHFKSDFQKHGSPAGSQRGRSRQPRSITDQDSVPQLNVRGGGPGSYSVASSEAMRNWNLGPPAVKGGAQGDTPSKENEARTAAFDPWTANLPTGDLTNEAETDPQTQIEAWDTRHETSKRPGSKDGNKDEVVSRDRNPVAGAWGDSNDQNQGKRDDWGGKNDQNQGNNGDDWGDSAETGNGDDTWDDTWGGTRNASAQNNDEWKAGGDDAQERNDDWNNSKWDASNNDKTKDAGAWDQFKGTSNGSKDGWGGNDNNTRQNGDWGATDNKDLEQDDNWGATTGNDAQRGNSWEGENGQQTDTWGGNDKKQVATGSKDPEKENKPISDQAATSGEKSRSPLSFGNSRAKGPRLSSKVGSQGKPASVKSKAASIASNKKPLTFDWLKPSADKAFNASGSPVAVKKASVPGAWASPVASPKQKEPKPVAAQIPPTFSMSTLPKAKPYWSTWRNANATAGAEMEEEPAPHPDQSEEPVYSISADVAQRNMMSHQVRPGRPAAYTHKKNKPKYMDTHESPYAVFLFKYRDKSIIESMFKTTIAEPEVDEKARLASLSKQELIDELIKTKSKLSVVESDSSGQATFVKKLDETLSRFETGKDDGPAVGDWVDTTSPTHGQGNGNAGGWGTAHAENGKVKSGDGGDKSGNGNGNGKGTGGDYSSGGNDGGGANGKDERNNKAEISNGAKGKGNGWSNVIDEDNGGTGDAGDWDATGQGNGGDKKDDNGWGGNDSGGGGGGWNTVIDEDNGHTGDTGNWGDDQGKNGWDNTGWGEDDGKKDKGDGDGNGNDDAGVEESWGGKGGGGDGW